MAAGREVDALTDGGQPHNETPWALAVADKRRSGARRRRIESSQWHVEGKRPDTATKSGGSANRGDVR